MELTGIIKEIGETVFVSEKFKKRELIVEYAENPSYPELIKFEAQGDKVDLLNKLQIGQEAEVSFNLRGRPWTDKNGKTTYFNTLVVWKVSATGETKPAPFNAAAVDDAQDGLPF